MFNKLSVSLLILTVMVVQFIYIPKFINDSIEEKWAVEVENYSDGLLERLSKNEKVLENTLENSVNLLKKSHEHFKLIETLAIKSEEDLNIVKIDSGRLQLNSEVYPNILTPNGCEANRGANKQYIKFTKPFNKQPEVLASFSLLDFGHGEDHRIKSEVFNITTTGFEIDFFTWCDTRMSQANVNWIAIGW